LRFSPILATGLVRLRLPTRCGFVDPADPVELIVLDATVSAAEDLSLAMVTKHRGMRLVMISGRRALREAFYHSGDRLLRKPFGREAFKKVLP
jgi:hypothetical protein